MELTLLEFFNKAKCSEGIRDLTLELPPRTSFSEKFINHLALRMKELRNVELIGWNISLVSKGEEIFFKLFEKLDSLRIFLSSDNWGAFSRYHTTSGISKLKSICIDSLNLNETELEEHFIKPSARGCLAENFGSIERFEFRAQKSDLGKNQLSKFVECLKENCKGLRSILLSGFSSVDLEWISSEESGLLQFHEVEILFSNRLFFVQSDLQETINKFVQKLKDSKIQKICFEECGDLGSASFASSFSSSSFLQISEKDKKIEIIKRKF